VKPAVVLAYLNAFSGSLQAIKIAPPEIPGVMLDESIGHSGFEGFTAGGIEPGGRRQGGLTAETTKPETSGAPCAPAAHAQRCA
jgi:hypothetical protein